MENAKVEVDLMPSGKTKGTGWVSFKLPSIGETTDDYAEVSNKFDAIRKKVAFGYGGYYTLLLVKIAYEVIVQGKKVSLKNGKIVPE